MYADQDLGGVKGIRQEGFHLLKLFPVVVFFHLLAQRLSFEGCLRLGRSGAPRRPLGGAFWGSLGPPQN